MPKLKTKRALAKKVKITKSGKILRSHQLRSGHLRRNKSKQALRKHKKPLEISKTIIKSVRRMLGRG